MASEGAERFAVSHGITPVPNESLISPDAKKAWNHFKSHGPNYDKLSTQEGSAPVSINETGHDTVGAVVMDFQGNLVAGTSTGGLNGKAKAKIECLPYWLFFYFHMGCEDNFLKNSKSFFKIKISSEILHLLKNKIQTLLVYLLSLELGQ